MIIIGLTGGSGSGKSTVAEFFCKLGAKTIDADAVYHELLETSASMMHELKKRFPDAIGQDGKLIRRKLAEIVFSDEASLSDLNAISHKFVIEETEHRMLRFYQENTPYICIDAIALFESGLSSICDVTIGVFAPRNERIARIMARDGIDSDAACARIAAQHDDSFFAEKCDYTIINNGDRSSVEEQVNNIFNLITKGPDENNE